MRNRAGPTTGPCLNRFRERIGDAEGTVEYKALLRMRTSSRERVTMGPGLQTEIHADVYRWIIEQATDAVIFADREGYIRIWNKGAESIFGYSADEALGQSLDIIIPEELRRPHWESYRKAVAAGKTRLGSRVLVTRGLHRDGSRLYVDLSFAVIVGDAGLAEGALAIGRDVTERYLADKALRKHAAELESKARAPE
jgi:PAS domain S-box-containing protein